MDHAVGPVFSLDTLMPVDALMLIKFLDDVLRNGRKWDGREREREGNFFDLLYFNSKNLIFSHFTK